MNNSITESEEQEVQCNRYLIDRSLKFPVLFFFSSATFWLMLSLVVGFISSIQAFNPGFMAITSRFEYPFMNAIHQIALVYGWGFNAIFGVSLWLTARMSKVELPRIGWLMVFGHAWNIIITIGALSVVLGGGSMIHLWHMTNHLWIPVYVCLLGIAFHIFRLFYAAENRDNVYPAQWFILASWVWILFALPTHFIMISVPNGSGVFAAALSAWFSDGIVYLWFVAIAIATILYLVPKVSGSTLKGERMILVGFWMLFAVGVWSGMQRHLGGPMPIWMPAVGGAATFLLVIPCAIIAYAVIASLQGKSTSVSRSPTLRFTVTASISLLLFALLKAICSLPVVAKFTQYSMATTGMDHVAIFGVFSMAMFGAMYFITPRISGCEWSNAYITRKHFWFNVYGVASLMFVVLVGGAAQGGVYANVETTFKQVAQFGDVYLVARAVCYLFLFVSNAIFFSEIVKIWVGKGRKDGKPLLLHSTSSH